MQEVKVPRISVNDDFVELVDWHVADGSRVAKGGALCSIETSKTTFEVEAESGGNVKILASPGDKVSVHETICLLYDDPAELVEYDASPAPAPSRDQTSDATKKAVRLAESLGVDLSEIRGTGIIREKDVRAFHAAKAANAEPDSATMSQATPTTSGAAADQAIGLPRLVVRQTLRASMWILYRIPIVSTLVGMLVRSFPEGVAGKALRASFYRNGLMHLGDQARIDTGALLVEPRAISIGDRSHIDSNVKIVGRVPEKPVRIGKGVHIGPGVLIYGTGGVTIGDYAAVAAGSVIYSARNLPESPDLPGRLISMSHAAPAEMQYFVREEVVIEDFAFVGLNVSILPGVTIGKGAIINSGAVVAKDVPPYTIFGGPPSSVVGERRLERKQSG